MSYDPMVGAADCHTGGLVAYFVTLVLIDISSVPEIKANPTRQNCLLVVLQEGDPNQMSIRIWRRRWSAIHCRQI